LDNRPIGIFDSGLGGLTVLKEIMRLLPGESAVYFGDSGRAPYGTKSAETVEKYTFQNIRFLMSRDVKMIVMACNTASAICFESVRESFGVPVVEVIRPGAAAAAKETKTKKVGVIGTPATVNSGAYEKAINKIDASIKVISKACPLFVPLVEEGWWNNDIARMVAREYLAPMKGEGIDALVLGCTHYPLLQEVIEKAIDSGVRLVSSATEAAKAVRRTVDENGMRREDEIGPTYRYYTSDNVGKFESLGGVILSRVINSAEKVDIEKY